MNTPEQPINPPEDGREYTEQQLNDAREDAFQELLMDRRWLMDAEGRFSLLETYALYELLALVMTDKRERRQDHIDDLKELFKSRLYDRATAMAMQYLSEQRD